MNESLTIEWVQYVVRRFSFAPRFLVKEALRQAGVDIALVPGVDENVPLADLEPDIYEEEVNESVVYEH